MIDTLRSILYKKVSRLFLVVWPPLGEESWSQIDISAGYVFEDFPEMLIVISTDMNDLTTPIVQTQSIPQNPYCWEDFKPNMREWMNGNDEWVLGTEYYEVSNADNFKEIVNHRILFIELIEAKKNEPFGIKLTFDDDYVLSTPTGVGNTIETTSFNQYDNLRHFLSLGEFRYRKLKAIET